MGVLEHPDLPEPADGSVLWRYLDVAKYLDLLHRRALWLSRVDCFGDPFEGHYSIAALEAVRLLWDERDLGSDVTFLPEEGVMSESILRQMAAFIRRTSYVNCWHMSEGESAALWSQYADGHGIAIVSSPERIRRSLQGETRALYLGVVEYVDFDTASWDGSNVLTNLLRKRLSFRHEEEVRLINLRPSEERSGPSPVGLHASVDLVELIDRVVVAPTAPAWYLEVVEEISRRFDLNCVVTQSRLAERP